MSNMRVISVLLATLTIACGFPWSAGAQSPTPQPEASPAATDAFADAVDLSALGRIAVHTEGRLKSFDSFARSMMQFVSGAQRIDGRSPTFTYLDLMLRPERYRGRDVIHFKNKPMRVDIAQALRAAQAEGFDAQRADQFIRTGLLAPELLENPAVIAVLSELSADVLRSAKFVQAIASALQVMDAQSLAAGMKIVPPPGPGADENQPWLTPDEYALMSPDHEIVAQWSRFTGSWQAGDAAGVNAASAALAELLPQVNPTLYPAQARLAWESWYFRAYNMTWVWILYALALIPLLLAVVFRWPGARWAGLLMFLVAFGFHTFALGLRWYVSGRWPNSNMFEAVTTAAWFGGCVALLFEIFGRRLPMRGLLALGSATASMCALMAVYFLPLQLNADIQNKMPVLNDVWLYIHTNVIILSYCLIFIAAVTAALYLMYRLAGLLRGAPGMRDQYARVGGAGSLILSRPGGESYLGGGADEAVSGGSGRNGAAGGAGKSTFGQVLDGTTMVVMEMSFILLWTGLVMGAIWADHSWGRPWGWDPKEVFALNTFLVFLILVHGRLKVKDKGLWTACMALIGALVMLFNWIIINFAITGLHSYA